MYNYRSDMSRNDPYYEVEVTEREPNPNNWINYLQFAWGKPLRWNGQHKLLPTSDSPTISACTTATNLSSLDAPQSFGSIIINNRRMSTLEENLRVAQPEIEPLHKNKKDDRSNSVKVPIAEDSNDSNKVYNNTTEEKPTVRLRNVIRQVIAALSVSLVSMVVGYVSAYTSPAAESMKDEMQPTEDEFSWVVGLMPLSALFGGLAGGPLIELLGRKWTILVTDLIFMVSWLVMSIAQELWYLYLGRALSGFSVGVASLVLPVYLGETVQPEVRGALGLLPTAFGNIGILVCYVAGSYLKWNHLAWLGVALPVPFLVLMFLIPETPRWYIAKGEKDKAKESLQWLRGKDTDIEEEFNELKKSQEEADKTKSSLGDLFAKHNLKPLLIALGLMFFQQMSGINAVIFYTTSIFKMAGSSIDNSLCTIIVGIVNFASTFIATMLIDRLGRKVLLYISTISMCTTLTLMATYFYLRELKMDVSNFAWLPLSCFVIYVLGFSLGLGPIPWLMMGEILPSKIRGAAASLATAFNWTCTFIVTKTFVNIIAAIGPHGTFWLFAGVIVVSIVFIVMWVPETRGQSLQDIERQLAGMKVRRMSSVANLKPLPSPF